MNQTWKAILAFMGIFIAGAVFGGFLTLRFYPQPEPAAPAVRKFPAPLERVAPQILERLAHRLELSPAQKEKIRPIIAEADREMRRLRQDGFRATLTVSKEMYAQVARELTPEQAEKLEQMQQEMRERVMQDRQRRWGERPPPPR
jgi:Spy/CpxP family protein refolding chaperone